MPEALGDTRGESRQSFYAKQKLIAAAKTTFQQLAGVIKNATIYPAAHPFLLEAAEQLKAGLFDLMRTGKDVAFYLVGGELFFETHSILVDQSLSVFMEQITSRGIGGMTFKPGISSEELVCFAGILNKDNAYFAGVDNFTDLLVREGITHIELHRALLADRKTGDAVKSNRKKSSQIFADAVETVKEMVHSIHIEKTISMRKINTMVHTMVDNILENKDALLGLTSIKMYDEYTFAHSVNVSVLSIAMGTFLSFDKPQIAALGVAGMMHDIGKVNIPISIINKPDKLTDQEWEILKRHPIEGALILSDIPGITKMAMVAAFEHHQHGDVKGYPQIGGMLQQHPFSQIISLADAYDAVTAARVYYSIQTPPDQAVRILLKNRGKSFDPVLVKAFVNMIGLFPIGTLLKLDTGEIGLVLHQTRDLLRPRVLLLTRFDGSEKESGTEVSLLETERGRYKRSVVGTIDPYAAKINVKQYLE